MVQKEDVEGGEENINEGVFGNKLNILQGMRENICDLELFILSYFPFTKIETLIVYSIPPIWEFRTIYIM